MIWDHLRRIDVHDGTGGRVSATMVLYLGSPRTKRLSMGSGNIPRTWEARAFRALLALLRYAALCGLSRLVACQQLYSSAEVLLLDVTDVHRAASGQCSCHLLQLGFFAGLAGKLPSQVMSGTRKGHRICIVRYE